MATVVITGANRGIGLEFSKRFMERGDTLIALCRQSSDALNALGCRVEEGVDVASDECVGVIRERLNDVSHIDILVNNAGLLSNESLNDMDYDRIRDQFEVNTLGPLRVTDALKDKLASGSKLIMVTSVMGSIAENGSGGMYGYRISKAALNIASVSLTRDLESRGVAVGIFHPGYVKTDMTAMNGNITPAESVNGLMQRIDELSMQNTGAFRHTNGNTLPW